MEFYPHLYVGESVRHPGKIIRRLKKGSPFIKAYVITLAAGRDLLEIYDAKIFAQKYYQRFERPVIGLAGDYEEAVQLILQITQESLDQRGDCDLKTYLLKRAEEKAE